MLGAALLEQPSYSQSMPEFGIIALEIHGLVAHQLTSESSLRCDPCRVRSHRKTGRERAVRRVRGEGGDGARAWPTEGQRPTANHRGAEEGEQEEEEEEGEEEEEEEEGGGRRRKELRSQSSLNSTQDGRPEGFAVHARVDRAKSGCREGI